MRVGSRSARVPWRAVSLIARAAIVGLIVSWKLCWTPTAKALASFARQTGQPCGACHTDYPGLTPYGRRFKIGGYTYGGGAYRTTLF